MAKNQKDLADSLLADDSPGWLTGFLADEEEFDRRALWRLGSWGVGSVGAVIIAILAHQSGAGLRHDEIAAIDLTRQSQQLQSIATTNQSETRRLASAIDTLNGDRDRLFARMTVLEQGLDSVTGSINRKTIAQGDPPKASSQKDAALGSPQAMPPSPLPDKTAPTQASALPPMPAPVTSSASGPTKAAELSGTAADAKTSDAPKTSASKTASSKTELPKADSLKLAEATASASPSPAVAAVASAVTDAAAETIVAKTSVAKTSVAKASVAKPPIVTTSAAEPPAAKSSPADPLPANSNSAQSQLANSEPAGIPPAADSGAAPLPILPSVKPATEDPSAAAAGKAGGVATATPAKPKPESDAQKTGDAKIVVASIPAVADAESASPPPADVPVAHTDFGVDLGSASSIKGLRALWRGVLKSDASELVSLRPIIVLKERSNGLGMQLRLVAGPLVDAAAAARICAIVSENGRACETSVFDGQRLAMKEDAGTPDPGVTAKKPRSSHGSSRHRHRRTARAEEPAPPPPPPPPKPSTFSSFFSR